MKNVLISGGSKGIGKAIALHFQNLGHKVAVTYYKDREQAEEFKKQHDIEIFPWNASVYDECLDGVKKVEDYLGSSVDILINNAGIIKDCMLHKQKYEDWRIVIQTNLDSVFNMSRQVINGMREKHWGRIISISSVNAYGMYGQTNYSASKAGIIGFTKSLALESASRNITVNAVAPGYINTEMLAQVPKDFMENKILPKIPIGRLGEASEIAAIVGFLATDAAALITGQVIDANGGLHM